MRPGEAGEARRGLLEVAGVVPEPRGEVGGVLRKLGLLRGGEPGHDGPVGSHAAIEVGCLLEASLPRGGPGEHPPRGRRLRRRGHVCQAARHHLRFRGAPELQERHGSQQDRARWRGPRARDQVELPHRQVRASSRDQALGSRQPVFRRRGRRPARLERDPGLLALRLSGVLDPQREVDSGCARVAERAQRARPGEPRLRIARGGSGLGGVGRRGGQAGGEQGPGLGEAEPGSLGGRSERGGLGERGGSGAGVARGRERRGEVLEREGPHGFLEPRERGADLRRRLVGAACLQGGEASGEASAGPRGAGGQGGAGARGLHLRSSGVASVECLRGASHGVEPDRQRVVCPGRVGRNDSEQGGGRGQAQNARDHVTRARHVS